MIFMLSKKYDSKQVEEKWQKKWEEWKIYKFDNESENIAFSIDTPPPTVSGNLHLGHATTYQDIFIRYYKMLGTTIVTRI